MAKQPTNLPTPEIYEQEYLYWPWGKLIEWIGAWVEKNAPMNALIVDYMCGTGFLINDILSRRSDLSVCGCSLTQEYVEWAKHKYSKIRIVLEDALLFHPPAKPDIILCTAGLHHLPYCSQKSFISKIASELQPNGRFIIAEEFIEADIGHERQEGVLNLWFSLMRYIIQSKAPKEILDTALGVMRADLFEEGEYKRSQEKLESMLSEKFKIIQFVKIWPNSCERYGDGLWICEPRSNLMEENK
jgi:cyclopropane fatty-acyl-phospholipid synthase-like methyltransferase